MTNEGKVWTMVLSAEDRQYEPGHGGSVCKRIRRTRARFVVAWNLKRHRWPKGMRNTRARGWRNAGMRRDLSTGGGFRGFWA